ncbi:MAG: glycosyltransferase [Dermatophilus congolensis]|nr:glycosyltransferase [Dermatophilus congolensis]
MKVCVYQGLSSLVRRSGVGQAMRHQEAMLDHLGAERAASFAEPFDVLHLNTVFPDSVAAGLLARARGARVVYFGHSTQQDFRDSWAGANAVAPIFGAWLKLAYSVGHVVVTPTPYSRKIIDTYGTKRPVHALSNGVDTDFFRPDPAARQRFRLRHDLAPQTPVVMSVGHLMPRKGVVDFVGLARRMPHVEFYWFGTAPRVTMPRAVREAIDTAPDNCHFAGFVPRDQIRDAYAGADLFAFLSHEETEGIVVLEAMASGVPVLLRDIPVYDDWLEDGVVVHKAHNLPEFELRARQVLTGELPDVTEAARTRMERNDLRTVARSLAGVYAGRAPTA